MEYKFREVICPLCDHRFTYNNTDNATYTITGDNTTYYEAKCPKCGEDLLVADGRPEGILLNDVPDGMITYHPILK